MKTARDIETRLVEISRQVEETAKDLDVLVQALEKSPPAEVATAYWMISEAYDLLDTRRKQVYALQDNLNKYTVPTVLQKFDMDLIRVPELKRSFYITPKYSASILDKERAYVWLRANGLGEIITETVNAGTLSKALHDLVADTGKDAPLDIFELKTYNVTGSSKYTPKEK